MAVISERPPAPSIDEAAMLPRVRQNARQATLDTLSTHLDILLLILLLWQIGASRLGDFWVASPVQVVECIGQFELQRARVAINYVHRKLDKLAAGAVMCPATDGSRGADVALCFCIMSVRNNHRLPG